MGIVTRPIRFLEGLVRPPKRPTCPYCGSTTWNRHGFYRRGQRCLDRLNLRVPIPRYRCLNPKCRRTWADQPPWLIPRRWYGRDVIRKGLDLGLDYSPSWREWAEVLRAEVAGLGRTSGVVEWLWRRFKRRMHLIQVFIGGVHRRRG